MVLRRYWNVGSQKILSLFKGLGLGPGPWLTH
jgi:hypothetical protein